MVTDLLVTGNGEQVDEIHLFTQERGDKVDAVIPLRWCICRSILDKIKDKDVQPYFLIVITNGSRETDRILVPLEQEMEYVSFQGPGVHRIQATVVFGFIDDKESPQRSQRLLEKKDSDRWKCDVLDAQLNLSTNLPDCSFVSCTIGKGEINVDVAPDFFSKKPPDWLWRWANMFYETRPRDQCQFRRRCIVAFTIQPSMLLVVGTIWCLLGFLIAVAMRFLLGFRGIDFDPVFHPLQCECFSWIWEGRTTSVWFHDSNGHKRFWWRLISSGGEILGKRRSAHTESSEKQEEQRQRETEAKRLHQEQLYSSMVCTGRPLRASLSELPKERRTLYLRFMNLKTRLCKPFAW